MKNNQKNRTWLAKKILEVFNRREDHEDLYDFALILLLSRLREDKEYFQSNAKLYVKGNNE